MIICITYHSPGCLEPTLVWMMVLYFQNTPKPIPRQAGFGMNTRTTKVTSAGTQTSMWNAIQVFKLYINLITYMCSI